MESSGRYPVGQPKTSSDLSFDKQHLRTAGQIINLDNVNIYVEILMGMICPL